MSDPVYSYSTNRYYPAGTSGGYYDPVTQQCVLEEESANPKPASVPAQETPRPSGWSAKKILAYLFYTGRSQGTSGCGYIAEKILNKPGEKDGGVPDKGPEDAKPDIPADIGVDTPKDIGSEIRPDAGPDAAPDAKPDVSQDAPKPDVIKDIPQPDKALDGPKPDITPDTIPPDTMPKPDALVCTSPYTTPFVVTVMNLSAKNVNLDYKTLPGSATLLRQWTNCWYASSGTLPGSPYALHDPSGKGGTPPLPVADPTTLETAMKQDSQTSNVNAYYRYQWKNPGILAVNGMSFIWRARLHSNESASSSGGDSSFGVFDDTYAFGLGLTRTGIRECASPPYNTFTMETMKVSNTFRGELIGNSYKVYINEDNYLNPFIGTRSTSSGTLREVNIGDNAGSADAVTYVNFFCVYSTGYQVPLKSSSESHEEDVINLGTSTNNIGTGATITTFSNKLPAGTSIKVETRTGPVLVPDGTWTPYATAYTANTTGSSSKTGQITSPANQYLQIKFTLSTSTYSVPVLKGFRLDACK